MKSFFILFAIYIFISLTGCTMLSTSDNDVTPPGEVSDLSLEEGNTYIALRWTAPQDADLDHFEIVNTNKTLTYIVQKTTKTFFVPYLENGVSYTFKIQAVDTAGNVSTGVLIAGTPTDVGTLKMKSSISTYEPPVEVTIDDDGNMYADGIFVINIFGGTGTDPVPIGAEGIVDEDACKDALAAATALHPDVVDELWVEGVEGVAAGHRLTDVIEGMDTTQSMLADMTPQQEVLNFAGNIENDIAYFTWSRPNLWDLENIEITNMNTDTVVFLDYDDTGYSFPGLRKGVAYEFMVKTIDINGNESEGVTLELLNPFLLP